MQVRLELTHWRRANIEDIVNPADLLKKAMVVGCIVAVFISFSSRTPAEEPSPGAREFLTHCAVCHGTDGRGDGPLADKLTHPPKDLTLLSKKNGGAFPDEAIHQIIDGRRLVVFHGSREMPIWGDRFRVEDDGATVRARILEIVTHLRSIQAE